MPLVLCGSPLSATTLYDAIRLAYQTNPTLRGQRAELRAVDEGYVQARSALGPQASFNGQVGYSIARVQAAGSLFSLPSDTTYKGDTGTGTFSFVQPLYSFGANRAQIRGAKDTVLAGREALRQAESEIIGKVITAYLDVRRDRETLKILRDEINNLTAEVKETSDKGELGELTRTDVAEAEGRLLQSQAQLDFAQGRLMASSAQYLDVVGENPDELAPEPELAGLPATIDDALASAFHNNPQILDAIQSEQAAREKVNEAKAAYGPTVSLRVDAGVQPIEPYLPNLYDRNVTVAAVVSQPLFTSGMRASKVREAADRDTEAMLQIEATRRDVVQTVGEAWAQFTAARTAESVTKRQVEAYRIAVEGNQVEERVGRRSTFELVNNELELANARIALLQNEHDEYLAKAALLAAMGLLEARNITPGVDTYDPAAPLDHEVRANAAPWEGGVERLDGVLAPSTRQPSVDAPDAGTQAPLHQPLDAPSGP
jgi:outer membrane protein